MKRTPREKIALASRCQKRDHVIVRYELYARTMK